MKRLVFSILLLLMLVGMAGSSITPSNISSGSSKLTVSTLKGASVASPGGLWVSGYASTEDCGAPAISNIVEAADTNFCIITWDTDSTATRQSRYDLYGGSSWLHEPDLQTGSATSHACTLSGLTAEETAYKYELRSCVAADTTCCDGWAHADSFVTKCGYYSYYGFAETEEAFGGVRVWWDTETLTTSRVRWKVSTTETWTYCTENTTYETGHDEVLCGLVRQPNKTYHWACWGKNKCDGTIGWSSLQIFSTDAGSNIIIE